jgi:hypothetical protein
MALKLSKSYIFQLKLNMCGCVWRGGGGTLRYVTTHGMEIPCKLVINPYIHWALYLQNGTAILEKWLKCTVSGKLILLQNM